MSMSVDSLKLVSERQHLVDVLMSGKQYADIILKGGNVVNVITREIYPGRCGCFWKIYFVGGRL